jgi:hypothetical protein
MAPIRVEVLLLSGRGVAVTAAEGVTVGDLKTVAQKRLAVGIAKLIHHETWQDCGLDRTFCEDTLHTSAL